MAIEMNYAEQQAQILKKLGITTTASTLLEAWASLVEECEAGYSWDYSEYRNELAVRDKLEALLSSKELALYQEHSELVGKVDEIDRRFRVLLNPDRTIPAEQTWWGRGALRTAGCDYAEYCKAAFSIDVQVKGQD